MFGSASGSKRSERSYFDEDRSFVSKLKAEHKRIENRYVELEDRYDHLSSATRRDLRRSGVFARFACRVVLGLREDAEHLRLLKPLLDAWHQEWKTAGSLLSRGSPKQKPLSEDWRTDVGRLLEIASERLRFLEKAMRAFEDEDYDVQHGSGRGLKHDWTIVYESLQECRCVGSALKAALGSQRLGTRDATPKSVQNWLETELSPSEPPTDTAETSWQRQQDRWSRFRQDDRSDEKVNPLHTQHNRSFSPDPQASGDQQRGRQGFRASIEAFWHQRSQASEDGYEGLHEEERYPAQSDCAYFHAEFQARPRRGTYQRAEPSWYNKNDERSRPPLRRYPSFARFQRSPSPPRKWRAEQGGHVPSDDDASGHAYFEDGEQYQEPARAHQHRYNSSRRDTSSASRDNSTERGWHNSGDKRKTGSSGYDKRPRHPPPAFEQSAHSERYSRYASFDRDNTGSGSRSWYDQRPRGPPPAFEQSGESERYPRYASFDRDDFGPNSRSRSSDIDIAPTPADKVALEAYNKRWDSLERNAPQHPFPSLQLKQSDLYYKKSLGQLASVLDKWSQDQVFAANVQLFFLRGFGLSATPYATGQGILMRFDSDTSRQSLQDLIKHLQRKELPRWHPDRMNLRTGAEGKIDESIGKRTEVVAVRTAIQELLEQCKKRLEKM